ncbi:11-oxo-beta-amyrin 30-oxidase-like [Senna tora]|uniref:11-oxo-beta-amyrin 30-oxidase-like n=1 Tax=Senna tora TaxID=362788 RepID=A0A834SEW6_9FABA|nr:11-oxo-beta-amyrin 30-oxidase-like [Senna tora]
MTIQNIVQNTYLTQQKREKIKRKKSMHPFTKEIMRVEMPKLKTPRPQDKYDSSTIFDAQIKSYREVMHYAKASDEEMCLAFPSTLKEDAQLRF